MTDSTPIAHADHVKPGDIVTYVERSDQPARTGIATVDPQTETLLVHGSTTWRSGFYSAERPAPSELDLAGVEAVLYHFGRAEGVEPGVFVTSLLETMSRADRTNRARLIEAFPVYGQPFLVASNEAGGTDRLAEIARRS